MLKKTLVALMCCTLFGGALAFIPGATANAAEQAATEGVIRIAEDLQWEGTPACGWTWDGSGTPKKNIDVATGGPIVVNGITYAENSIGTHLPAEDIDQDIVYDISAYSSEYNMFEVFVAQPDGNSANWPKFTVLVDGVVADIAYYRAPGYAKYPVRMSANVEGAKKLTLRVNQNGYGWSFAQCVWLDPVLYRAEESERTYASDLMQNMTASATGWDFGYTAKVMEDQRGNGSPFTYWDGAVSFGKGLGAHLKSTPYSVYETDKSNAESYVSIKYDIEGRGFGFFNAVVYIANGNGAHVDVWIDGNEVYTSGTINSIAQHQSPDFGVWEAYAGRTVNVKIPANAKEFEIRIIAEVDFADGLVDLCDAAFFQESDMLWSRYAEETRAEVWPHAFSRGTMWSGTPIAMHDGDAVIYPEKSLYALVGTEYLFDIQGLDYNYFYSRVGLASINELGNVWFNADVIYADGTVKTYTSQNITLANSGQDFEFVYEKEGAKQLKLYLTGEQVNSDCIFGSPRLGKKLTVSFDFGEGEILKSYIDPNTRVTQPETPAKEGYTFAYWYETDESEAFSFDSALETDTVLHAKWQANSYTVTVVTRLEGEDRATSLYESFGHVYGTDTRLPEVEDVTGYDFLGWYLNDEKIEMIGAYLIDGDVTVRAEYVLKTYQVTFKDGIAETIVDVKHGKTVAAPADPAKEGYTFLGWFTDEEGETAYDFESSVTGDMTLHAVYKQNAPADDGPGGDNPGGDIPGGNGDNTGDNGKTGLSPAMIAMIAVAAAVVVGGAVALVVVFKKKRR